MESLGNFPDPFIAEIHGQPDALRRAAASVIDHARELDVVGRTAHGRTVVVTGMGSSYDAGYPAVADLARAGVPSIHVDAAELLHFRSALLGDDALLIAVSQSGESAEVVQLLEVARGRPSPPCVVGVTNGTDNTLAAGADVVFDTRTGVEVGPSTMTFAASLVAMGAIGHAIAGMEGRDAAAAVSSAALSVAGSIERLLDDDELRAHLDVWAADRATMVVLGRGPARAASEMAALTIKESAGIAVESLQTAQFRHGPLELVGPDLAVAIVATEPETRGLDLGLAQELVDAGAAVLVVTSTGAGPADALRVAIGALDRSVAPAAAIVPLQLVARSLAIRAGRRPGEYYRATKVTTHE